jgi:DNA-directed RNA polymerase II subunit RPB3
MEYDPHNKLRHTSYWFERDPLDEWPISERNGAEEAPPREGEPFDYTAVPRKFFLEIETVGSVTPQEVVLKARHAAPRRAG